MPAVDMPLAQLRDYMGSSPRPKDFDTFWDTALDEMRQVQPNVELVPAAFQVPGAECFDLYFTGVGGSRIHAKYLRPAAISQPLPVLLQFHGYSGNAGDWWDKLAYVSAGFAIAAMDCRGQHGTSEDRGCVSGTTYSGHFVRGLQDGPKHMLFRQIYLDTAQLAGILMGFDEVDETRLGAFGGSQGGALTLACAALEPRIKRAVPYYPFLSDFRRVWDMDLGGGAYQEMRSYLRSYDPLHRREDEFFNRLGYIDVQNLAGRIRADVLFGATLRDDICPPSSQFAAYNKITSHKEMLIYPDFGHEGLPGFLDEAMLFLAGLL